MSNQTFGSSRPILLLLTNIGCSKVRGTVFYLAFHLQLEVAVTEPETTSMPSTWELRKGCPVQILLVHAQSDLAGPSWKQKDLLDQSNESVLAFVIFATHIHSSCPTISSLSSW